MLPRVPLARLAIVYAAYFAAFGVFVPFWPVWLRARAMSEAEIGVLLAAGVWVRVLGSPLAGHVVDRLGRSRTPIVVLAWASCAVFALFGLGRGFVPLLAISLGFGLVVTPILPLNDHLTMQAVLGRGASYGRIRLWGSLAFLGAAVAAGRLLQRIEASDVFAIVLALLVVHGLVCLALPDVRAKHGVAHAAAPLRRLLRNRRFLLCVAGASLTQGSHAVFYGFATLHWRAAGIAEGTIGVLWATGVVAEIVLFWWAGARGQLGATRLLVLGAAGGVLRWTCLGLTIDVGSLLVLQTLHALTFGATHLGAVHYISRTLPAELSASGQALYSGIGSGLCLGLGLLASGPLFDALRGGAFVVMVAPCVAALVCYAAAGRLARDAGAGRA